MWDAQEKVDELELYVQMQGEHYADRMDEMMQVSEHYVDRNIICSTSSMRMKVMMTPTMNLKKTRSAHRRVGSAMQSTIPRVCQVLAG